MFSHYVTLLKRRMTLLRFVYILTFSASLVSLALHFRGSFEATPHASVILVNIHEDSQGEVPKGDPPLNPAQFFPQEEKGADLENPIQDDLPVKKESIPHAERIKASGTSSMKPLSDKEWKDFRFNVTIEKGYMELVGYLRQRIPEGESLTRTLSSFMQNGRPKESLVKSFAYGLIEPYYTKFRNFSISYLIKRATKEALNDFVNITLMEVAPGDIVEIDRHFYSHWAIYLNEKEVLNLYNLWNGNATIKVSTFDDLMGDDLIRVNNFEPDAKKRGLKAFPREQVLANAWSMLHTTFPYQIKSYNCEQFVTEMIFGKGNGFSVEFEYANPYIDEFLQNSTLLNLFV